MLHRRILLLASALLALSLVLLFPGAGPVGAQDAGIAGVWRGTYTCAQGVTGLVLRITGSGEAVTARFEFFPDPSNPGVASGAYTMTGRYDTKSRALALRQERWVDQPQGYIMVDLDGILSADGRTLAGRVGHESCSGFTVSRADK